jgi:hypothetical protein
VVAYVVADYWQHQWENRKTVNLSAMTEKGGPADLLMLSSGDMNSYLGDMGERGFVEVQRRIPPYQVMRLWDDPAVILERIYDS